MYMQHWNPLIQWVAFGVHYVVWPTELILVTSHGNSMLECISTDMYMYICFFFIMV